MVSMLRATTAGLYMGSWSTQVATWIFWVTAARSRQHREALDDGGDACPAAGDVVSRHHEIVAPLLALPGNVEKLLG